MTATINASTTTGVVVTSDTSGALALQTANTTAMTISSAQVVNFANAPLVGGSALPSSAMTLISTKSATSQSSVSWTGLSGYNNYVLISNLLDNTGNSFIYSQFGTGATPTYITSGYLQSVWGNNNGSFGATNNTSLTQMKLGIAFSTQTTSGTLSGYYYLSNFLSSTGFANMFNSNYFSYETAGYQNARNFVTTSGVAISAPITAIKIYPDTGTFAGGTLSLYGISS